MKAKELYNQALEACNLSYAPYSKINVGAAALLEDLTVVQSANFENISSPACTCAEQSLIGILNSLHHNKKVLSIAIAALRNGDIVNISPCGVCRQILSEYQTKQNSNISITFKYDNTIFTVESATDLLPKAFK